MKSRTYSFNYRSDNCRAYCRSLRGKEISTRNQRKGKARADVEKLDPSYLAGGNTQCCRWRPAGQPLTASSRTNYTAAVRPADRLPGIYPGE